MRLKTETRNKTQNASVMNGNEETHQLPQDWLQYSPNIRPQLDNLDVCRWCQMARTRKDRPSYERLDPLLSVRLVLGFVAGFVPGCRLPSDNTFVFISPFDNTFCQHFYPFRQQSFSLIIRSFFTLLSFINVFSLSRKDTRDQVMSRFKYKITEHVNGVRANQQPNI